MQTQNSSSVFELLAKPVRKALVELGFSEPTLPQILAFPLVLEGCSFGSSNYARLQGFNRQST